MVFSSHLFLFYFLPVALAFYYLAPAAAEAPGPDALQLRLLRLGQSRLSSLLMLVSTLIDWICRPGDGRNDALEPDADRGPARGRAAQPPPAPRAAALGRPRTSRCSASSSTSTSPSTAGTASPTVLGVDAASLDIALRVTLPLGISFYTFQSMSYTIDVYRGDARALRNFVDFACYVSMFPQLVAGPIVRFSEVADQLAQPHPHAGEVRPRRRLLLPSAWPRRSCSPTRAGRSPTPSSTPARRRRSRPGTASSPTPSRSTSTSPATPTWRSASG